MLYYQQELSLQYSGLLNAFKGLEYSLGLDGLEENMEQEKQETRLNSDGIGTTTQVVALDNGYFQWVTQEVGPAATIAKLIRLFLYCRHRTDTGFASPRR